MTIGIGVTNPMRSAPPIGLVSLVALLLPAGALAAPAELPEAVETCLLCHADPELTLALEDGDELSLTIDAEHWAASVHAGQLVCTDCHAGYDDDHPMGEPVADRRSYQLAAYETCKPCHFDTYTRAQESVHAELLEAGVVAAPICTDCHGAHDVADPHLKQAMVSRSCGSCHDGVYEVYGTSVHGSALLRDGNRDVPACPDCHSAHTVADPSTARFRLASPSTCAGCHGDPSLMARYGIPTDVAETYLADFHGVTASLSDVGERDPRQIVVTCVDCHGAHDTASPALVGEAEMKASVQEVCASCHADAAVDFPAAWLSHHRPSLRHAPLVWGVNLFYTVLIPFIVLGLAAQVLLHLYRLATGR